MRYVSYVFYGSLSIVLVLIAIANRSMTELNLIPKELGFSVSIFQHLARLRDFLWRHHLWCTHWFYLGMVARTQASRRSGPQSRELRRAERELRKIKGEKYAGQDDVLALLDETS